MDVEELSSGPIGLIQRLATEFERAGIVYCHWKSNEALRQAVAGDQDLDLLVSRRDSTRFASILHDLGFILARPERDRQLPGILDYYGVDDDTARVVHVHAHYQLVLGDDMTKNFRLPVEDPFLASRTTDSPLPIPSAEWEYLVFVLRMVVKHSPWDAQLARKGKLSMSERRELADLTARASQEIVNDLRERHLPLIDAKLFGRCVAAVEGSIRRPERMLVARCLLRTLEGLGRHGRRVDLTLRVWRRALRTLRARSGRHIPGKRPDVGGSIVAMIGSDGAGKTTAVRTITQHLSKDIAVEQIHMGKPPWSRLTRLIRRPIRKARTLGIFTSTREPPWVEFNSFPGYAYCVWHVLIARDRYLQHRHARRLAGKATLVISDRWPLQGLRTMDGPRLQDLPGLVSRPLARWLAFRERRYYASILGPDLLLVLRVTPEVAAERRTEDPEDFVLRRASEIHDFDWDGVSAVVIDADLPVDDVQRQVRSAIWDLL